MVSEVGDGEVKRVRVLSRRRSQRALDVRGETPLLTASRVFVTDNEGVRTYALPSGALVRRLTGPAGVYAILPSPDGRRLALASLPGSRDRFFLADVETRRVRRIAIPRMRLLGWLASDRLAIRADRRLQVLDPALSPDPPRR